MHTRQKAQLLAVVGLALPMAVLEPQDASAQTVFTQQQIIHSLRRMPPQVVVPQGQIVVQQPQQLPPQVLKRAPQPGGQVARMRAPEPVHAGGHVPVMRPPEPGGNVQFMRSPQPQYGEVAYGEPQQFGAPPTQGTVQQFRAPPPQGPDQAAKPGKPKSTQLASASARGLDVRPAANAQPELAGTNYPDSGRIDLEILFDYDSARIDPASVKQLFILGEALNDPSLGKARIVIAGHTDAAGSNGYNADLSLRRARAVSDFLVNYAGVEPDRLVTEGYGEELLKYPDAPESGQNRRVEIINLGEAG